MFDVKNLRSIPISFDAHFFQNTLNIMHNELFISNAYFPKLLRLKETLLTLI
jgi:hypothetical protein